MAYPPAMWEQEGISAFKTAVSDSTVVEHMVITRPNTLDDCADALARVECHRENQNRLKQQRRVCEVVAAPPPSSTKSQALKAGSPKPARQLEAIVAMKPNTSATGQRPVTADEVAQIVDKVLNQREQRQKRGQGKDGPQVSPRGSPGRRRIYRRENPSKEHPCRVCGSPDHWASSCPQKQEASLKSGNEEGLDSRSKAQSQE